MQVIAHTDQQCFDELHAEWSALVPVSQANLIFSTPEWHKHWWAAYRSGQLWVLEVRADDRKLAGILPLFIEEQAERGNVARIIGSDDVTDYLDIIAHCDHIDAVYEALAAFLSENRTQFDVLEFSNIREESPTYKIFEQILATCGYEVTLEQQEVCPLFSVPDSFDAYLESLESKQRSELKRKLRRAEGYDEMAWYIVGAEHNLDDELQAFLKLMAASHPEKAKFLQNPQHIAFFNSFMPVAMEKGWLQLNFQVVEEERVATYLNFDYNNDILVYNSGLAPNKFGSLSPGIVLLANNIQWAIDHKKHTFNFLRGNETYKYQMGGKDTHVFKLTAK